MERGMKYTYVVYNRVVEVQLEKRSDNEYILICDDREFNIPKKAYDNIARYINNNKKMIDKYMYFILNLITLTIKSNINKGEVKGDYLYKLSDDIDFALKGIIEPSVHKLLKDIVSYTQKGLSEVEIVQKVLKSKKYK